MLVLVLCAGAAGAAAVAAGAAAVGLPGGACVCLLYILSKTHEK